MYGEGISLLGELVDLGVKLDLVQKSGSWFSMGETRLGQGRDNVKQYLKDNPDVAAELEANIRRDFFKLMSSQSQIAAKAAGRAVDVSAEDFNDEVEDDAPAAEKAPKGGKPKKPGKASRSDEPEPLEEPEPPDEPETLKYPDAPDADAYFEEGEA